MVRESGGVSGAMTAIIVHGCTESYVSTDQRDCAELLHDQFHYNVPEALGLAKAISRGQRVVISVPLDCDPDQMLQKLRKLGLECSIGESDTPR
ncbi:MAG: hypothetical protein KDI37_10725 [Xanthomonadales bacterium]|nr:hypothetical protein [Xanthomonadales bacterium]